LDTSLRTISMSQAFYDVEALESLLEERERDLELAARIGQTLLEKNRQLVDQVEWRFIVEKS
jgi:trafficking kinesin-binding protein 1